MKYTMLSLALLFLSHAAFASDLPDFPFVHAEGRAVTNVAPDTALIRLTVENHSETASNAVAVVEGTAGQLVDTLISRYGISTSDIITGNISKEPVHRRGGNYELLEIIGYKVSRSITIEVSDIHSFPGVMSMIAQMDHVTNISADFKHSEKERMLQELTAAACRNAGGNAELLSEASGVPLGDLFAVSADGLNDLGSRFRPYIETGAELYGTELLYGDERTVPFFVPDTIKYEASVATIYRLGK